MNVARALLLALPVLGLVELGAHVVQTRRPPSFDAWREIAAPVREVKQDGDVIVVAPAWAEPAARRGLGDELMPIRDLGRPDMTRYAHAVEVSILGAESPDLKGFREISRREHGKFVIRRLENPTAARVVYDFVDHARPPDADVRGTDPKLACAWNPRAPILAGGLAGHPTFPPERFECPGGPFFNVGVTVIPDQDFKARRCLWSHPFAKGEIVTTFHKVPLGQVIRGHGGLSWFVERDRRGAPITLAIRVDGEPVGSFTHSDGEGWKAFEMQLGAHAGAAAAEVEIAVSTRNYRDRHFCFEADTR